jgi:hypothetical protein
MACLELEIIMQLVKEPPTPKESKGLQQLAIGTHPESVLSKSVIYFIILYPAQQAVT